MTTSLDMMMRRASPARIAELTRSAHRRALGKIVDLDPIDQMEDVAATLSELTADVAAIVILLALGKSDEEVRGYAP